MGDHDLTHVGNLVPGARRRDFVLSAMQADLEPTVRIRELLKDRVDFVLENVDLACVIHVYVSNIMTEPYKQLRELPTKGHDGRHSDSWYVCLKFLRMGASYTL